MHRRTTQIATHRDGLGVDAAELAQVDRNPHLHRGARDHEQPAWRDGASALRTSSELTAKAFSPRDAVPAGNQLSAIA